MSASLPTSIDPMRSASIAALAPLRVAISSPVSGGITRGLMRVSL
jgi:hypothetical protein